jgi:hypothetical protein
VHHGIKTESILDHMLQRRHSALVVRGLGNNGDAGVVESSASMHDMEAIVRGHC